MMANRVVSKACRGVTMSVAMAFVLSACGGGQDLELAQVTPSFYKPPSPLAAAEPGTVIRTEPLVGSVQAIGSLEVKQYKGERIMYHSRTNDGRDIATTGMLFLPDREPPYPLVAFGHGTSGVVEQCAPSIDPFGRNEHIKNYYGPWLDAGYAVVGADYLGAGAPGPYSYLVGRVEGQNVLDSARAAHNLHGDKLNDQMFLYGHSQGGNSVGFAAEILPEYAPELNLDGVLMAAPAALLHKILELAYDPSGVLTPYYGTTFLALAGISYESTYGLNPSEIVKPQYAHDLLPIFKNVCSNFGGLAFGINACVDEITKLPLLGYKPSEIYIPLSEYPAPWNSQIAQNSLGARPINAPIFIAQGCNDHTLPPVQSYEYFKDTLCAQGESAYFQTYKGATHKNVLNSSTEQMIRWADKVRDGNTPASNCSTAGPVCEQGGSSKTCPLFPS